MKPVARAQKKLSTDYHEGNLWISVLFFGAKKSTKRNSGLKSHHAIYVRQRSSVSAGLRVRMIFIIEEALPNV